MKRLGVYACIAILTISFFGDFITPKTVKAQGTPTTQITSIADYQSRGAALFSSQLQALNQRRANPNATGTIPTTIQSIDALIQAVTNASALFSSTLFLSELFNL